MWQPIETAPRNGSRVLVFEPPATIGVALWARQELRRGAMRWCVADSEDGVATYTPTHWQPLPDPPKRNETLDT